MGTVGTGTLNLSSAGKASAAGGFIGLGATAIGTINLSDAGSVLDIEKDLTVGASGRGTVNLNSGAAILVGDAATGTSELRVADSNLAGDAGGNVVLNNQSTWAMNDIVRIAQPVNTTGRLSVNGGSTFSTNSAIIVGDLGSGVLDVATGGRVAINGNSSPLNLGSTGPGGRGTVTVDGAGSLLDVNNSVSIGNVTGGAVSTLTVRNNGLLLVGDLANPTPAPPAATRVLVVDGTLDGSSGGVIDVRAGSLLDATGGNVALGSAANSFGRINLIGANARLFAANVFVGGPGRGQLDVAGGAGTLTGALSISGAGSQVNLTAGTLTTPVINAAGGGFGFTGGRLATLVYNGTLTQAGGTLAVSGANTTTLTSINGNFVLNSGTVELQINATTDDILKATGALTLNSGNLTLIAVNTPTLGEDFFIIRGSSRTGIFATVSGVSISPTLSFAVTYNSTDVRYTVALPGDASLNRSVGFEDLLLVAQNFGLTGRTWVTGDFDGSGSTVFADLLILAQNFGTIGVSDGNSLFAQFGSTFAADWALAQSLAPEPASLAAILLLPALVRRRLASGIQRV